MNQFIALCVLCEKVGVQSDCAEYTLGKTYVRTSKIEETPEIFFKLIVRIIFNRQIDHLSQQLRMVLRRVQTN